MGEKIRTEKWKDTR